MKEFNLEKALAGEPVVTRDGRPVKIAGYDENANYSCKILGWVQGSVMSWLKTGEYYDSKGSSFDLFMATTERKEYLVRRYDYVAGCLFFWPFNTRIEAEKYASDFEGTTIHEITIHE